MRGERCTNGPNQISNWAESVVSRFSGQSGEMVKKITSRTVSIVILHLRLDLFLLHLGGPKFNIVQFVIILLRELNCIKTPQCGANKSASRLDIYAPKVE